MITKTNNRIRLCIPKHLDNEAKITIRNAVVAFGFLVKDNTEIGFRALAGEIERCYSMSNDRVKHTVRILKRAEPYVAAA